MRNIVISGTGVFTPEQSITNEELVKAYNSYAASYNLTNKDEIEEGTKVALESSSEKFIYNASGIKNRYVMDKKGILDPNIIPKSYFSFFKIYSNFFESCFATTYGIFKLLAIFFG